MCCRNVVVGFKWLVSRVSERWIRACLQPWYNPLWIGLKTPTTYLIHWQQLVPSLGNPSFLVWTTLSLMNYSGNTIHGWQVCLFIQENLLVGFLIRCELSHQEVSVAVIASGRYSLPPGITTCRRSCPTSTWSRELPWFPWSSQWVVFPWSPLSGIWSR